MKREARNLAQEDRPATLHELGQVIGLLIATDQLPLTARLAELIGGAVHGHSSRGRSSFGGGFLGGGGRR